ncbi:MAG: hypothetical protein HYU62_05275 [Caulobacterales bacterium]|nr:hypothetical protein [Caulobacterales bacterium]
MKRTVLTAAALLLAAVPGVSNAQTAPQDPPASGASASDLTRDLNSGPPTIEEYLARPVTPAPSAPAPTPRAAEPAPAAPPSATTPESRPSRVVEPAPRPRTAPITPPESAAGRPATPRPTAPVRTEPSPTSAPVAPAEAPPPPSVPTVTVLDSAARAALPFTVDLPSGFEIVTGRPGPDFRIYTIRRGGQSFAMIYAGPASQFPIYSGQMIEAGGRASVVSTESGERHAREHLFQRPDAPREVHVWTMSLEGADRALAERIAQSVDVR